MNVVVFLQVIPRGLNFICRRFGTLYSICIGGVSRYSGSYVNPYQKKLTLYKLIIRSILSYAAPVWSNTSVYNYRRLQVSQSECLRVIGNYPRHTPTPFLHATLNIPPIQEFIYLLTDKFFNRSWGVSSRCVKSNITVYNMYVLTYIFSQKHNN